MTAETIDPSAAERNEEDYTGACCLLVRDHGRRRHARIEALIDADRLADVCHLDWVIWRQAKRKRIKYVVCISPMPGMNGWILGLHRFLTNPPEGMLVDHRNRNPSDNRSSNLRVCTPQQNCFNSTPDFKGGSKYKGVTRGPRRKTKYHRWVWKASISIEGKPTLIGWFDSEAKAAFAYNVLAERHRGEYAYLNDVRLGAEEATDVHRTIDSMIADRQRRKEWTAMPPAVPPPPRMPLYAVDLITMPPNILGETDRADA